MLLNELKINPPLTREFLDEVDERLNGAQLNRVKFKLNSTITDAYGTNEKNWKLIKITVKPGEYNKGGGYTSHYYSKANEMTSWGDPKYGTPSKQEYFPIKALGDDRGSSAILWVNIDDFIKHGEILKNPFTGGPKLTSEDISKFEKVYNEIPSSKYSTSELITLAKKVGHKLFDSHSSGLIWGVGKTEVKKTNTLKRLEEDIENMGSDSVDFQFFNVGTFEFVFFPSSTEKAFDASDHVRLTDPKLVDKDGNIYLMDNTDTPLLTIMKPNLDKKDFKKAKMFLDKRNKK